MNKKELLLCKMAENDRFITTKEALNLGVNKNIIKALVDEEKITRITHGFYCLPNEDIDEYIYFRHRVPNGIFSHETAAYLHNLANRMPLVYIITVKSGYNTTRIKRDKENVIFKYTKEEYLNLGLVEMKNPYGNKIRVYDKERTVLDLIKDYNKTDREVFADTLKNYFQSDDMNILKLYEYAKVMKLEDKVRMYAEVLI